MVVVLIAVQVSCLAIREIIIQNLRCAECGLALRVGGWVSTRWAYSRHLDLYFPLFPAYFVAVLEIVRTTGCIDWPVGPSHKSYCYDLSASTTRSVSKWLQIMSVSTMYLYQIRPLGLWAFFWPDRCCWCCWCCDPFYAEKSPCRRQNAKAAALSVSLCSSIHFMLFGDAKYEVESFADQMSRF